MAVDFETDLLVVTAAGGKQCAHLLPLICKRWKKLRLIVNRESSLQRLSASFSDAEIRTADLTDPSQAQEILRGAKVVYHIGPSFHPHETEIGYNMIDSAKSNGVEHFVYSSVLQTQLRKLMNHDCKRYVEEALMESGLNYTILQPTHFMDMFRIAVLSQNIGDEMKYPALWNPSVEFSFIALQDFAAAGATVLGEREKHYFAVYPLCSTMPMSYHAACEVASAVIGKKIVATQVPFEDAIERLLKNLFGNPQEVDSRTRDAAERMLVYYNRHGLSGNPNVLEWLIGKKATTFKELLGKKLR